MSRVSTRVFEELRLFQERKGGPPVVRRVHVPEADFRRAVAEAKTTGEAASLMGITRSAVYGRCRRLGLQTPSQREGIR